jgi:hypothetical protein
MSLCERQQGGGRGWVHAPTVGAGHMQRKR